MTTSLKMYDTKTQCGEVKISALAKKSDVIGMLKRHFGNWYVKKALILCITLFFFRLSG